MSKPREEVVARLADMIRLCDFLGHNEHGLTVDDLAVFDDDEEPVEFETCPNCFHCFVSQRPKEDTMSDKYRALVTAALALRITSPVNNDFPEIQRKFDSALNEAREDLAFGGDKSLPASKNFRYDLGQHVRICYSEEHGYIIGRSDRSDGTDQYNVRYKAADGRAVEQWWSEEALSPA